MSLSSLKRTVLAGLIALNLSACSFVYQDVADLGATLADLEPPILPAVQSTADTASIADIEASYRSALAVTADPTVRQEILVRLADIQMVKSERDQYEQAEHTTHFNDAIAQYNALLATEDAPLDAVTDERLLYRLAKAYALDGRMDESNAALDQLVARYPLSPYAHEVRFRMAEHAFSAGQYPKAMALYEQVVAAGDVTPFYTNALYMYGWSQFKDNRFRASIAPFTQVLDRLVPEDGNLESLTDSNRGLVTDTLRVMGITFSYLDGAKSITEVYATLGERHYQHLLYQQLAQFYLEKTRFADAATTYDSYTSAFPNATRAPQFALERLEVLKKGGMGEEVLAGKEAFVANFGIHSDYWAGLSPERRETDIKPVLLTFLDELSSFYHAKAQALVQAAADYQAKRKKGDKSFKRPKPAAESYLQAASYYQHFADAFPEHETTGEKIFLMAEAYHEANDLPRAVATYEAVAFERLDQMYGSKAGYNAIVTIQKLIDTSAEPETKAQWQTAKIQNAILFADFYPFDAQAAPVLTEAANTLFEQGAHEQALPLAERLTAWDPPQAVALQKTAWLIVAHTKFDAGLFTEAEAAYHQVLTRLTPTSKERPQIEERIAASMFKSAEQKVVQGDIDSAINQWLAIENISPGSKISVKAQYEAGNYLMEQKNWSQAEVLLQQFKGRYPQHALTKTLAPKFALIYQELKQWDKAAAALTEMANSSDDPETKRQTLYLAAELYHKSGREKAAIDAYKKYIKAYPQPLDLATEARNHVLEMVTARGDANARRYWLQQLIRADKKAGKNTTERAHYLAAYGSSELALEEFNRFERIKLTLPIKKSFKSKKKALERTLDAYKTVINYGVGDFVTEANYRIGNVYSQLSRDLLDSERPKGLDDLAMEQYEILLEEQAYPFEEKSVELLAANAERAWDGYYDDWVKQSLKELAKLLPARYGKQETTSEVSHGLH